MPRILTGVEVKRKEVAMFEIEGKFNTAICYASVVEDTAVEQIRRMCDHEFTAGSKIRIMPDVHAGAGCTIGTTMTVVDKVVPNIVGVDIGCGMFTVTLGGPELELDLPRIDEAAHLSPAAGTCGRGARSTSTSRSCAAIANCAMHVALSAAWVRWVAATTSSRWM